MLQKRQIKILFLPRSTNDSTVDVLYTRWKNIQIEQQKAAISITILVLWIEHRKQGLVNPVLYWQILLDYVVNDNVTSESNANLNSRMSELIR